MLPDPLLLLQRLKGWRLAAVFSVGVVIVVELIVALMGLLLKGSVPWDYLLTGFVTAALVAPPTLSMLAYLLDLLARQQQDLLTRNLSNVENQLKTALQAAQMASWELNFVDGVLTLDESLLATLSIPQDSPPQSIQAWIDIVHPEDLPAFMAAFESASKAGGPPFSLEYRVSYQGGGWRWIHSRGMVVDRDAAGNPLRALGISLDIQERKENEAELVQHRHHLEEVVEKRTADLRVAHRKLLDTQFAMNSVGIGIRWSDMSSKRLIDVNSFAAGMLGYTREEMLRLRVMDIYPPDAMDESERAVQAIREKGWCKLETRNRTKGGALIPVEVTLYYVSADDELPARLISFVRDITARKKAEAALIAAKEAAEAANVAKSAFLANMSHEIRTPLNAITGMAHIIRRTGLAPDQLARLEKIEAAGQHLLEIINAVLELSKIEAGKFAMLEGRVVPGDIVSSVVSLLQERASAKQLMLLAEIQPMTLSLLGDATRLQQALLNYAGNAVKFTDQGVVIVRVRLVEETPDAALIRFEVEDTGIGIDPAVAGRLFSAFEQADNSNTRKYGGTGLGLAITRKLAEMMGGEAGMSSMPGQGSLFWFTACLKKGLALDDALPESLGESPEDLLQREFAGRRVLLVEDEPVNQEVASAILKGAGLAVDVANDGKEAVVKACAVSFDLILMDVQMPNLDGLAATRQIRASGRLDTPIVAMTANAFAEDKAACLAAGMSDFLAKPAPPGLLYATVLRALRRAEGARQAR